MASKGDKKFNKLLKGLVILTVLLSAYNPILAPKADAQFVDVARKFEAWIDRVGRAIGERMVEKMVKSTIKWANTGFEGGPAYVTDSKKYFGNIASGVMGDEINSSALGFLCSPFQASIKIALLKQSVQENDRYACTIDQIGTNLEDFSRNFSNGGWDAWIKISQEDQNNPQGAFLKVQADINEKLANALAVRKDELSINSGFLNKRGCLARNPEPTPGLLDPDKPQFAWPEPWNNPEYYRPDKAPGECIAEGAVKTPGVTIKEQLDKVLPTGFSKLVTIEHLDQLVTAFLSGALDRFVFNKRENQGLFDDSYADTYSASQQSGSGAYGGYGWKFCAKLGNFCAFSGTESIRLSWYESSRTINSTRDAIEKMSPASRTLAGIKLKSKEVTFTGGLMCEEDAFDLQTSLQNRGAIGGTAQCEYMGILPPKPPLGTDQYGENYLACSPENDDISVDESTLWIVTTTYPDGTQYGWTGEGIETEAKDNKSTDKFRSVTYDSIGGKLMQVTAFDSTGEPVRAVDCSKEVIVSPKI